MMTDVQSEADTRPLILCSNDDGFFSRGLRASVAALRTFARVVVVAPETEQSATSHSLTLHRPLRLRRVEEDWYALDGTPVDCIYLALHLGEIEAGRPGNQKKFSILPRAKPDLVVSGINRGLNLGQDVFYSGTVAAAREGALRGVPSLASSVGVMEDMLTGVQYDPGPAAELVARVAQALLKRPVGGPTPLVNLNVPPGKVLGVKPARLGKRKWLESIDARVDPRGRPYFWIGGKAAEHDLTEGTDTGTYEAGYASITMLSLDLARDDAPAMLDLADLVV